jgi:hypothetical protein
MMSCDKKVHVPRAVIIYNFSLLPLSERRWDGRSEWELAAAEVCPGVEAQLMSTGV